jgi:hypothetical protein
VDPKPYRGNDRGRDHRYLARRSRSMIPDTKHPPTVHTWLIHLVARRGRRSERIANSTQIEDLASSPDRGQAPRTVGPIQRGDCASARC